MTIRRLQAADLAGKVIDVHSHLGVSLKSYACSEYPYAQNVNVVFPFSPDLFFDLRRLTEGVAAPDARPISPAPYVRENQLLLQEVFCYCPELEHRFLPFVSVDPGREIAAQVAALEQLERDYPIYGIKIIPVFCQTNMSLLTKGDRFEYARTRPFPVPYNVRPP